jgi:superfamily II DNA or RNA helicase
MTAVTATRSRPVYLTREGDTFRVTFAFDPALVARVKTLPYATFHPDTKTWTALVCAQSVDALRSWFYDGLTDVPVDDLLAPGEAPAPCAPATLREGTTRRPFVATVGLRADGTFEKLTAIPGASWDKKARAVTFPPLAAPALADLVARGVLADPDRLLAPAETVVAFDVRTGRFTVRGQDPRAAQAFARYFPATDVVTRWRDKGLDVAFSDPFTEEVYRGEIARHRPPVQPQGLSVPLYEFQARNVAVALERTGFAIVDEPGLGKTVQAIAVGASLLAAGAVTRVCVLVPGAVRTQWASEIVRFTGADPGDVVVVRGDPAQRAGAYAAAEAARWFVVHYDVLAKDLKALSPLFTGALVVADEAHRLKTYNAARTKAALKLCAGAARRLALSGTPLETSVAEWYQVLSGFAVPGFLGGPKDFNARYRFRTKHGWEGARNLAELRERSRPHYARHTKAEVASHLPPLRVEQLVLDPGPTYAAALRRAHNEAAAEIEKYRAAVRGSAEISGGLFGGDSEDVPTADMNATTLLRMLCSSPRLVLQSASDSAAAVVAAGLIPDEDGPKLDELRVMAADFHALSRARQVSSPEGHVPTAQEVQGERFVVFTFSRTMAHLIAHRFAEDQIPYVLYTGDTSAADRDAAVAAFTDPTSDVIAFIATDAAAEGLNLGVACSTLIQFDPPWTPSRSQQRVNRIHRIDGTASSYRVINMVLAGTMERGVYEALGNLADVQDKLFGEENTRYKATGRRTRHTSVFAEAMARFAAGTHTYAAAGRRSAPPGAVASPAPPAPEPVAADEGDQLRLF